MSNPPGQYFPNDCRVLFIYILLNSNGNSLTLKFFYLELQSRTCR